MSHTIYVVDIDGTLCDNRHREHMIPEDRNDTKAWVAFNNACAGDTPRWDIINQIKTLLAAEKDVRFLTGRGRSAHAPTLTQLKDYFGIPRTLLPLYMRPMGDYRKAADFKLSQLKMWAALHPVPEIKFVAYEDDPDVCEAMRAYGVEVIQVPSLCSAVLSNGSNK